MKMSREDLSELITTVRHLCRKLDMLETEIESGLLNTDILPEYINERDWINSILTKTLTNMTETDISSY